MVERLSMNAAKKGNRDVAKRLVQDPKTDVNLKDSKEQPHSLKLRMAEMWVRLGLYCNPNTRSTSTCKIATAKAPSWKQHQVASRTWLGR